MVSTLLVSGSAFMGWLYFLSIRQHRLNDDQYRITAIVQNSSQGEPLKTAYLAEILDLSSDKPTNIYRFDIEAAQAKLLTLPLIKQAQVRKILPSTLYVQYEMRTPVMLSGNYKNTGIDNAGYQFPLNPFFTPKRLSTLYAKISNENKPVWGAQLEDNEALTLALRIQTLFEKDGKQDFFIEKIDLSNLKADSYGQRQIILIIEKSLFDPFYSKSNKKIYIRLSPDHYKQGLINFFNLYHDLQNKLFMNQDQLVIDFRVPHLAFIKKLD